jgi:hypothetical protein
MAAENVPAGHLVQLVPAGSSIKDTTAYTHSHGAGRNSGSEHGNTICSLPQYAVVGWACKLKVSVTYGLPVQYSRARCQQPNNCQSSNIYLAQMHM